MDHDQFKASERTHCKSLESNPLISNKCAGESSLQQGRQSDLSISKAKKSAQKQPETRSYRRYSTPGYSLDAKTDSRYSLTNPCRLEGCSHKFLRKLTYFPSNFSAGTTPRNLHTKFEEGQGLMRLNFVSKL